MPPATWSRKSRPTRRPSRSPRRWMARCSRRSSKKARWFRSSRICSSIGEPRRKRRGVRPDRASSADAGERRPLGRAPRSTSGSAGESASAAPRAPPIRDVRSAASDPSASPASGPGGRVLERDGPDSVSDVDGPRVDGNRGLADPTVRPGNASRGACASRWRRRRSTRCTPRPTPRPARRARADQGRHELVGRHHQRPGHVLHDPGAARHRRAQRRIHRRRDRRARRGAPRLRLRHAERLLVPVVRDAHALRSANWRAR